MLSISRSAQLKKIQLVLMLLIVTAGVVFLLKTQAAIPVTSLEAESSVLPGSNLVVNDSTASSAKAIRFANQKVKNTHIIYSSNTGMATAQIWKMKTDGSGAVQLTNDPLHEYQWARPSLDGKSIVYTRATAGESVNLSVSSNTLWIMDADGANQREIISESKKKIYNWTGLAHPEWSPDSQRIVLAAPTIEYKTHLFVVDTNGNNPTQLTDTVTIDGQVANAIDPSWGVNNTIVFIRNWDCLFWCNKQDVYKIDLTTKQETRITNDVGLNWDPFLSPDGKTFIWLYFPDGILSKHDLYRGNATGPLNPQPIISDGGSNSAATFSSDGKRLLFLKAVSESSGLKQRLHQINLDGTGLTSLSITDTGEAGMASYWP